MSGLWKCSGSYRIYRGSGHNSNNPASYRSYNSANNASLSYNTVGFRVALYIE